MTHLIRNTHKTEDLLRKNDLNNFLLKCCLRLLQTIQNAKFSLSANHGGRHFFKQKELKARGGGSQAKEKAKQGKERKKK
jgi:hypothetical protein